MLNTQYHVQRGVSFGFNNVTNMILYVTTNVHRCVHIKTDARLFSNQKICKHLETVWNHGILQSFYNTLYLCLLSMYCTCV